MQGRRWLGGSCRLRIGRSTAGTRPPLVGPWPVRGWLRVEVTPSGGMGSPGAENGRGVDGGGIAVRHTERTKTSEKVRGAAGERDGEGFGRAVVEDGEANKFGGDEMGFSVVKGR